MLPPAEGGLSPNFDQLLMWPLLLAEGQTGVEDVLPVGTRVDRLGSDQWS